MDRYRILLRTYALEFAAAAVAVAALVMLAVAAGAPVRGDVDALVLTGLALLAAGVGAGSFVRRLLEREPLEELRAHVGELEERPSAESFRAAGARAAEAERDLASARAELTGMAGELQRAERERARLSSELDRARVTASLDRFSASQLLGMCDVADAEDRDGFLSRPYNDPIMEQLLTLEVAAFDATQTDSKELKWTLAPAWRQAVRAQRAVIDERTAELRARRTGAAGE